MTPALWRALALVFGASLFAWFLSQFDLLELFMQVANAGWTVVIGALFIYLAGFYVDSITWHLCLTTPPLSWSWSVRIFLIRVAGETYNALLPAAGFGGEPLKILLLKRHYGIDVHESTASVIVSRTVNLISLIIFLLAGFALIIASPVLQGELKWIAGIGLGALSMGTAGFWAVQHHGGLSTLLRRILPRQQRWAEHMEVLEAHFAAFYRKTRGRVPAAIALALVNWLIGTLEVWFIMLMLGVPVSFAEALIIESATQLVRTGAFFIPAALGAQEGVLMLMAGALTGQVAASAAMALIRRARELLWLALGVAISVMLIRSAAIPTDAEFLSGTKITTKD